MKHTNSRTYNDLWKPCYFVDQSWKPIKSPRQLSNQDFYRMDVLFDAQQRESNEGKVKYVDDTLQILIANRFL